MFKTDLVFRSVGERTANLALELAIKNIRPNEVHRVENVRPFSAAVDDQLKITHKCDQVVYVDADCLILDDMVPFLEFNGRPYVDCFVTDRFRGRIHCGVHVTRLDVIAQMSRIEPPSEDWAYVLRPESRLRNLALRRLKRSKEFRNFNILHDHFQYYRDIFSKYALRELRSRGFHQKAHLEETARLWTDKGETDLDFHVARLAIEHARENVAQDASPSTVERYIGALPQTAVSVLEFTGVSEKDALSGSEVDSWLENHPKADYRVDGRPRVFGIGLSRTGTRSLTMALHTLGWDTIHYPVDQNTLEELSSANYAFSVLREYNGITDITVGSCYPQVDALYPGSKFILTVRERTSWLRSCKFHWQGRSAFKLSSDERDAIYLSIRRLLRASVFGCYSFDAERFAHVYNLHVRNVLEHFKDRPEDLLVLDICGGEGWEKLCSFLEVSLPNQTFPHKGNKLTQRSLERIDQQRVPTKRAPQRGEVAFSR